MRLLKTVERNRTNTGRKKTPILLFHNQRLTSNETIKLLEHSEFIRINTKKFNNLAETKISVSRLINDLIIEHAVFLEELLYLQSMSGKERYETLIKGEPQVLQRVSLTDLASFLGMSRETLSRIRSNQ